MSSGFAIWLTGLPAAGKSTLAQALADVLQARGVGLQILDSDELRAVLTPQPTYSQAERDWFYRVLVYLGELLTQNGVNVVWAATANRQRYRDRARESIERFVEVYVRCPLEVCMARDPKGLYEKGLAGEISRLPGLQAPYEVPHRPELVVDTGREPPQQGARRILAWLETHYAV